MDITSKKFQQEIDNRIVIKIPCCAGKCEKHELPSFLYTKEENKEENEDEELVIVQNN
jgi:hypothetical protein